MIPIPNQGRDSVSPAMLIASCILHGAILLCLVLALGPAAHRPAPQDRDVTRVKLVEYKPGPPTIEKLDTPSSWTEPATNASRMRLEKSEQSKPDAPDAQVKRKRLAAVDNNGIKFRKRKPARRSERPAPKPKEPQRADKEKKENSDERLERLIDRIRKRVAQKKAREKPAAGAPGTEARGDIRTDPEVARWLLAVRSAVNAQWPALWRKEARDLAVEIGVQVADDGRVTHAGVDKSSGDRFFDQSALRAVWLASPFPPVPEAAREELRREKGLALEFTPGGLQWGNQRDGSSRLRTAR